MYDPFGGSTWALSMWQDAHLDLDPNEQMFDSCEALAAAQTWEEVLTLPTDPTQRLPRLITGDPAPRTQCPVRERPNRGRITVTRGDGSTTTLAADGSPVTATGGSSKRAAAAHKRTEAQRARALAAGEVMADARRTLHRELAAAMVDAGRAPILEDGVVVGYLNPDGSIG